MYGARGCLSGNREPKYQCYLVCCVLYLYLTVQKSLNSTVGTKAVTATAVTKASSSRRVSRFSAASTFRRHTSSAHLPWASWSHEHTPHIPIPQSAQYISSGSPASSLPPHTSQFVDGSGYDGGPLDGGPGGTNGGGSPAEVLGWRRGIATLALLASLCHGSI